ncbi:protein kinase [Xenophilus arseniciresistens]|uniref:Protein kinase n=1 Tax=Xenophilus arseniciresistens TaxID=1283306 RepID=A0AAE3ND02_9BURK|nr:bifunctional protein-serine/threonine kinase/phosphatase [Xenophilus arseniciresistens]MDA7419138.1 protein kinase [Xenophilus arseniciresistens]
MSPRTLQVSLGQHSAAAPGKALNQDFHGAMLPGGALLARKGIALAVADGIGSSPVSQVASAAAVRCFLDDYYATSEAWSVRRAGLRVLAATNAWLHAQDRHSHARLDRDRGHVCTFSALILKDRSLHLFHVGDSRVYRVHAQALEQLTQDHRVNLGDGATLLGRALGAQASVEIDHHCWPAEAGELYLLATDGACAGLDAARVHAALAACEGDDLDAAARQLVAQAQSTPGCADDATVQILRIDALPAATHGSGSLQARREGLALPPALAPRSQFEGFTLVRELHVGPRSHVHLAVDSHSGLQAVIKVPATEMRENAAHLDSFVLEEWVARRVDSPHVIKAFGALQAPARQHLFVALEHVQGQTLAQWMVDHPRPGLDAVRGLVTQLARGLQALHQCEMLHQDLRPENVMIDPQGTVKLIDLGSAWVAGLHDEAAAPGPDTPAGSLQYSAPEYFTGQGGDARSDLFSLAVLCYQMLSGELPYGLQVTRVRHSRDVQALRYESLRTHRPDLPAWVDAVLRKALHPQPHRRQEAVSEFVFDLSAPGEAFTRPRRQPLVQRHPVRFWQACTALLAMALVAQAAWHVLGR